MNRDKGIDWSRKRLFIPADSHLAFGVVSTADIQGFDAGAPVLTELSTFGYGGALMAVAGDKVAHALRVPYDMDPQEAVGFTVLWTSGSSTVADTIDWIVLADFKAVGAALIAPATALDTAIAQDTVTGANHVQRSSRGIKNSGFLSRAQVDAGAMMVVSVEMDAFAAGLTEAKQYLGLEVDYVVRATKPSDDPS